MSGWMRDALANTSPSLSYRHSMIPSPFFRQQEQQNQKKNRIFSPSDDDDETDDESNDHSFYHNPYHSSGQMNYTDLPQQQYTNEHNYPTYLAQKQISNDIINQSLDEQIQTKLLSLKHRTNHFQSYTNKPYDYRLLQTPHLAFISNVNEEQLEEEEEEQKEKEEEDDDYGMTTYYPDQYPNFDEHLDFPSVVLWYRNVMQSVKKLM